METKRLLQAIGLDGKRADLYLAGLELGPTSVLSLSKKAGVHRPALYKLLAELVTEGVFITAPAGGRTSYAAVEPERLLDLIKRKERLLEGALPGLKLLAGQRSGKPRLEYYQGREQLKALYRSVLADKPGQVLTYFPSRYMAELFGKEAMVEIIQERIRLGIHTKTLRVQEGEIPFDGAEDRQKALREVRYVAPDLAPSMGVIVANDTVDLYSPIEECYGMRVKSASFAALMRQYFLLLWTTGQET